MYPSGTIANLLDLTRRKLWFVQGFDPGPLDCALCGKRAVAMRERRAHPETDSVLLCRSCFQQVIKTAVQTPERIVRQQQRVS